MCDCMVKRGCSLLRSMSCSFLVSSWMVMANCKLTLSKKKKLIDTVGFVEDLTVLGASINHGNQLTHLI